MPVAVRKVALTDKSLKALKPAPAGRRATVWDALMPGLAVRITDRGKRSFYAVRRRAGEASPTWASLGVYPVMSLAEARTAAREALGALIAGQDPRKLAEAKRRAAEIAEREAAAEAAEGTFAAVAEKFIALYLPRLRSARVYEARVRRELIPVLGSRPVAEIRRREIVALLEDIAARSGPEAARGALAVLSKALNWAVARDLPGFEANPAAAIRAGDILGKAKARDRLLSDAELALIWRACEALGESWPAFATLYRVLLVTGARRAEIAEARWADLDLAAGTLLIPSERAKNSVAQLIPLVPTAVQLLAAMPRFTGPYVFTTTGGRRPLGAFAQAKAALDKEVAALGASVPPWVVHDLRRAVRSGLGRLGVPPIVAELCLGHVQRGVAGIYDRHSYLDEKRDALLRWEEHLRGVVSPPGARVIPMRQQQVGAR